MDASFRPDAPRELALERERRLNEYRNLIRHGNVATAADDTQQLVAALQWVEQLAATGHVSARRLLQRAAERAQLVYALWQAAPALLARISPNAESTAGLAAWASLHVMPPDARQTEDLLQRGGPALRALGGHLRAFHDVGATVGGRDLEVLGNMVLYCRRDDARGLDLGREKRLLRELAQWRLESTDAETRAIGGALALKAGERGDEAAWALCWNHELALEKERGGRDTVEVPQAFALTQRWFAQGRPPVREAGYFCMLLAVACEAGRGGQAQDFAQALAWWERAFCGNPKLESDGTPGPAFCETVVAWLKTAAAKSPVITEVLGAWEFRRGEGTQPGR